MLIPRFLLFGPPGAALEGAQAELVNTPTPIHLTLSLLADLAQPL